MTATTEILPQPPAMLGKRTKAMKASINPCAYTYTEMNLHLRRCPCKKTYT